MKANKLKPCLQDMQTAKIERLRHYYAKPFTILADLLLRSDKDWQCKAGSPDALSDARVVRSEEFPRAT